MSEPAPTYLRTHSAEGSLAVCGDRPHLSWRLPDRWTEQDGYVLQARIDDTVLEVDVTSSDHLFVSWPWPSLPSRATASWRVRARRGAGLSAWSEPARFEVGLLASDWTASWISPPETDADREQANHPAYSLQSTFVLDRPWTKARLYATALGVHEVILNGHRVGDTELAPGSTSYSDTLYAQAEDITEAVREGRNEIEIVLSDGWYRGKAGAWRKPARWGTRTAARLELHLQGADGNWTVVCGTDRGWTSRPSAVVRADLMDGQTTDLAAPRTEAVPVEVDAVDAPPVDYSPAPPVRRIELLKPVGVTRIAPGTCVVDFGQNTSGRVRLTSLGPAGTRTTLDHGEHVYSSGDLTTGHLDSARPGEEPRPFVQRDEVVSDGTTGSFTPRHTIHGFRYAKVHRDDGTDLDASALSLEVVHSDLRPTATFTCSDRDFTRLYDVARWSFRGNAVDVPTDCPTRERLGWTGDYQVFVSTAVRMFDVDGFSRKWLRSVRDDQLPDGRIVNSSPDANHLKKHPDPMVEHITGSAGWGDAIVHVPWVLYETYGDHVALTENWDAMVAWVNFALGAAGSARHASRVERSAEPLPHERYLWDGTFHWGEWCEPKKRAADGSLIDPVASDPMGWFMADKGEVGTAYLYRSVRTLSSIAAVLGKGDDALRYGELSERIRSAWQTEFLDDEGRTTAGTQASYVRALAFDLVPARLRAAAAHQLVTLIREADHHLDTGFLSTADLLPVLADTGHADIAYAVLTRRTQPSWLGMLDRGATTIWEEWDGVDENGQATASLNHYSKGAVVRFLHSHLLGLRQAPGSTAWQSFVVAPVPGADVTWASGTFEGPQGTIAVDWSIEDGTFRLDVEVPSGSAATVVLLDGTSQDVGPGRVRATCPAPTPAPLPVA